MVIFLKLLLALLLIAMALLSITPFLDRWRQNALRRILKDVTDVLNAHEVDYWCDYGTLLGLVREADLILGDKDVDLCVLDLERSRVMAAALDFSARGYDLTGEGGCARKLMRVFDRRTPFHADIYSYVREGDTLQSLLSSPIEDVPSHLVTQKKRVLFRGVPVSIPEDPGPLLAYRYGPGYMTPRRNDKGRAGGQRLWDSLLKDLEASVMTIWFLLKRAMSRGPERV